MEEPDKSSDRLTSRVAFWLAVGGTVINVVLYLYGFFVAAASSPLASEILKAHYAAIVGIPAAAAVSFILVVFLRQTEGPIGFEGLGFKFEGAAGQVVM